MYIVIVIVCCISLLYIVHPYCILYIPIVTSQLIKLHVKETYCQRALTMDSHTNLTTMDSRTYSYLLFCKQ